MGDQNLIRKVVVLAVWGILIILFSLSKPLGYSFELAFPVLISPLLLYVTYWACRDPRIEEDSPEVIRMKEDIETYEKALDEQFQVIKEYENIFDEQLIELPCVCGGNTFKGMFSPNNDMEVECEKCHSKYRVEVAYNSILISEPMDQKEIEGKLKSVNDNH